jgi:hypothetical protein
MTIELSTMTAPTERSMPAVRMMSVWAIARVPTTATCCVIRERFAGFQKRSFRSPKTITEITSTIAGLIAG